MRKAVDYEETFSKNARGVSLLNCRWLPRTEIKALVFICHAWAFECSHYMKDIGLKFAGAGYAVFGLDCEGHGRSQGPRGYVKKFENVVDDYEDNFKAICKKEAYRKKPRYLYGDCMGGAAVIHLHRRDPSFWNGAILVAPMCRFKDDLLPSTAMINMMGKMEVIFSKWKLIPNCVIDVGFRDPVKREEAKRSKVIYQGKVRVRTLTELIKAASTCWDLIPEVTLPLIVLHGEQDAMIDSAASRKIIERAASSDKTLKLYPEMWHGLANGEPDEELELVRSDMVTWLDERAPGASPGANPDASSVPVPVPVRRESRVSLDSSASLEADSWSRAGGSPEKEELLCEWSPDGSHFQQHVVV
ncbi:hypothetical protein H6P81_015152 [Aristolochia fimbriata]|uniref:Serine aminopeptidase S33 domain-containing protein n=1 Tax=Aristolochia fimbriata TaxID=158543 RepID=A0AAV7E4N6_ARIFI|nr:hypothetical protein H6P81_015152 [Aristolochia fimbriata]